MIGPLAALSLGLSAVSEEQEPFDPWDVIWVEREQEEDVLFTQGMCPAVEAMPDVVAEIYIRSVPAVTGIKYRGTREQYWTVKFELPKYGLVFIRGKSSLWASAKEWAESAVRILAQPAETIASVHFLEMLGEVPPALIHHRRIDIGDEVGSFIHNRMHRIIGGEKREMRLWETFYDNPVFELEVQDAEFAAAILRYVMRYGLEGPE